MRLPKSAVLFAVATFIGAWSLAEAQQQAAPAPAPTPSQQVRPVPPPRRSPIDVVSVVIGDRRTGPRVMIVYGRQYTKDPRTGEPRKIWGGLVPYGKVWRTGANEATLLLTQQALTFGDVVIPPGACTIYTIPTEDGGKLIFNRQILQWGTQYDEKQDIGRVDLKKEALSGSPVDQFTIAVDNNPDGAGTLKLVWENAQYSATFTVAPPPTPATPGN